MSETANQKEARIKKQLGKWGENIAITALRNSGYGNVKNLNEVKVNHPFADIYAEKAGEKYVISVKTRNKLGEDGKENTSYNLTFGSGKKNAQDVEDQYNAEAHWMAVTVEETDEYRKYSVYFGSLKELNGRNAIPMRECQEGTIGRCLVDGSIALGKWEDEV